MQIVTLIGNRPQFVKAAAVSRHLRERHDELLVHSGQHYDDQLSKVFFDELDLPAPDRELGVGSASDTEQIALIMHAFAALVQGSDAGLVLVYGDTNTTLAGALAASRAGVPLAHVEAGMRSFDRTMPEERNRILADHLSALCLCSTDTAIANLRRENVSARADLVGDVMADVTLEMAPIARERSNVLDRFGLQPDGYLLVTAHRPGNVDDPERLAALVEILCSLPRPSVFPVHPRTRARLEAAGLLGRLESRDTLRLTEPLGYLDFTALLASCAAVLTDSGGVQKEAYLLEVPCITMRESTEWVETVELGWNRLTGLDRDELLESLSKLSTPDWHPELYGGGRAGVAVVDAIDRWAADPATSTANRMSP